MIAAVGVLAGREGGAIAVRDAVRARRELLGAVVQLALLDAFDRFTAAVLERRVARERVEADRIGVQDRVFVAIDEVGVPAQQDRVVAVVMRVVADDLAFLVKHVHVPVEI